MTTARAFVIGHPIGHSRSPLMHGYWIAQAGLDATYDRRDVAPSALPDFIAELRANRWIGCNVTIPHKLAVMDEVDVVQDVARAMGSVNCIWWEGDTLVGGNTDATGFLSYLDICHPGWDKGARRALILGAGGAARAAAYGLRDRGLAVDLCNRTAARARSLASHLGAGIAGHGNDALPGLLADADILVNTTSLGMTGQPPLDLDLAPLKPSAIVNDVVYAPLETPLLKAATARGLRTVDGLGMLIYQGVEGFRSWFGVTPEVTPELRRILEDDIQGKTS